MKLINFHIFASTQCDYIEPFEKIYKQIKIIRFFFGIYAAKLGGGWWKKDNRDLNSFFFFFNQRASEQF